MFIFINIPSAFGLVPINLTVAYVYNNLIKYGKYHYNFTFCCFIVTFRIQLIVISSDIIFFCI